MIPHPPTIFIWGENASYEQAHAQPYLSALAASGESYANYFGVAHDSQPNYYALTSGAPQVSANIGAQSLGVRNVGTLAREAGLRVREYRQPGAAPRHYFLGNYSDFSQSDTRTLLESDRGSYAELLESSPPELVYVVLNDYSNGHDPGVAAFDAFLSGSLFFSDLLKSEYYTKGSIVIGFDESSSSVDNRIYNVVLGASHTPRTVTTRSDHYTMLRWTEQQLGLPSLNLRDSVTLPRSVDFQWETQLAFPRADREAWVRTLASWGVSSVTMSVLNVDGRAIGRAPDILNATLEQRTEWREYIAWLNSLGIVPIIYLSEAEHNGTLLLSDWLRVVDLLQGVVGDSQAVLCLREECEASYDEVLAVATRARAAIPGRAIVLHSPLGTAVDQFDAVAARVNLTGLLDGVLIQCAPNDLAARASVYSKQDLWVMAHEEAPANTGTDAAHLRAWVGAARSAGCDAWSIYPGYLDPCTDLDARDLSSYPSEFFSITQPDLLAPGAAVWPVDRNHDGILDAADWRAQ